MVLENVPLSSAYKPHIYMLNSGLVHLGPDQLQDRENGKGLGQKVDPT